VAGYRVKFNLDVGINMRRKGERGAVLGKKLRKLWKRMKQ
jgi:hypothetical protein